MSCRRSGPHNGFRRPRKDERGAAAVEFALVAPILLILLFGVIRFGFVMSEKATVANAAREGVRFGSVNLYAAVAGTPRTCSDVVAKARANAKTLGMSPADLAVTVKRGDSPATATTRCSAAANSASVSGPNVGDEPCKNAASTDMLYVVTTFSTSLNIPMVSTPPIVLSTTGAARCEYS